MILFLFIFTLHFAEGYILTNNLPAGLISYYPYQGVGEENYDRIGTKHMGWKGSSPEYHHDNLYPTSSYASLYSANNMCFMFGPESTFDLNALTLMIWARHRGSPSSLEHVIAKSNMYRIFITDNGGFRYTFDVDVQAARRVPGEAVMDNTVVGTEWKHLVATFDDASGLTSLYVNGEIQNQASQIFPIVQNNVMVHVGSNDNATNYFDGDVTEVAVFNRVLSSREILEIYRRYNCSVTCEHSGICTSEGFRCENCSDSWTGKLCDTCSVQCYHGGVCSSDGSKCENCDGGWTGDDCDTCGVICQHGGVCNSTGDGCKDCEDGWGGRYCEVQTCLVTCQHGGICNHTLNGCKDCDGGWEGRLCDFCAVNCTHEGTCEKNETTGEVYCGNCFGGWKGRDCSTCGVACENGERCNSTGDGCSCQGFWRGKDCGECAVGECLNGGWCMDNGEFCECEDDYDGENCEDFEGEVDFSSRSLVLLSVVLLVVFLL